MADVTPSQYPNMGPAKSVAHAYRKWCKPSAEGDDQKVTHTLRMLDLRGWDIIANHADSVNGFPIYICWNADGSYSIHADLRRNEG